MLRLFFRLHIWLVGFSYNFNKGEQMSKKITMMEKTIRKQIAMWYDSLRLMALDAAAGERVDDTTIRRKIANAEEFVLKHFGEAVNG